jgi:hypothetical protein
VGNLGYYIEDKKCIQNTGGEIYGEVSPWKTEMMITDLRKTGCKVDELAQD